MLLEIPKVTHFSLIERVLDILFYYLVRGSFNLVRAHERGRGSIKSVRHAYKGKGADTSKYVRKMPVFARIL